MLYHLKKSWLLSIVALSVAGGCAAPAGGAKTDRSKWVMKLYLEDQEITLPLEVMYVHLTENQAYPESFEIRGPSVYLVGEFPVSLRIGYEEDWEKMIKRGVKISSRLRSEYYWIDGPSMITLPNEPSRPVSSGSFIVRQVTGTVPGLKGDMTLSGDITLNISVGNNMMSVKGTFSVHAVSLS